MIDQAWRDSVLDRAKTALSPNGGSVSALTLRAIIRDLVEIVEADEKARRS